MFPLEQAHGTDGTRDHYPVWSSPNRIDLLNRLTVCFEEAWPPGVKCGWYARQHKLLLVHQLGTSGAEQGGIPPPKDLDDLQYLRHTKNT